MKGCKIEGTSTENKPRGRSEGTIGSLGSGEKKGKEQNKGKTGYIGDQKE
jgi:hypothetical protein